MMEPSFASPSVVPNVFAFCRPSTSQGRWTCTAQIPTPSQGNIDLDTDEQKKTQVRAIRQSLPTARERKWLSEQKISVDRSRGARYSRQESFSLAVRQLGVERAKIRFTDDGTDRITRNNGTRMLRESEKESTFELNAGVLADAMDRFCPTDLAQRGQLLTSSNQSHQSPEFAKLTSSNASSDALPSVAHSSHSSLDLKPVVSQSEPNAIAPQGPLPKPFLAMASWAYIVRVRVSKFALGKRAVVRNRAQRRVRAALRSVYPAHASRGHEYVVKVYPAALLTPFPDLVEEAKASLRETNCWQDTLGELETRRPRYNKR
jgi:RNase P protein component